MDEQLRKQLIAIARHHIPSIDPSHDIGHALRVLSNAEYIQRLEGGDMEVIVPAALFHDLIVHPKDHPRSKQSAHDSALLATEILGSIVYSSVLIPQIAYAIESHSSENGILPLTREARILQDADRLEVTGAIALMRTFCSTGQMGRAFYSVTDPLCEAQPSGQYALDYVYTRLLTVARTMHTETARSMAKERTVFVHQFLRQLETEIGQPLQQGL
jgi:uncharacterized protein